MSSVKRKTGFTLIELIVAIAVITSGVLAVFSLLLQSHKVQRAQEGEAQAVALAQEGIEIVRYLRDSNWLAGCPDDARAATPYRWDLGGCFAWNTGLFTAGDGTAVPMFDDRENRWALAFDAAQSVSDDGARLYLLQNNVITAKTQANAQRVKTMLPVWRLMTLRLVCRDAQQKDTLAEEGVACGAGAGTVGVHAISSVRWNAGNGFEERTIEERLYNWR